MCYSAQIAKRTAAFFYKRIAVWNRSTRAQHFFIMKSTRSHFTNNTSRVIIRTAFAALFVCALVINNAALASAESADGYEYVYEDEGYEYVYEDEVDVGAGGGSAPYEPEVVEKKPAFRGYYTNVGGGIIKIVKKLVDEVYINETSEYYDCVKRIDTGILALDIIQNEDEDVDEEVALQTQINDLRKKLGDIASSSAGEEPDEAVKAVVEAETEKLKQTELKLAVKKNQLTFRELQALKMAQRLEMEMEIEEKRPKFRLGSDCETLVCGACKAVVEEFSHLVYEKIDDPNIKYIEQVTKDFCKTKNIEVKYTNLMTDICENFEIESLGYKETLIRPFEEDGEWDQINSFPSINRKKKEICLEIGACEEEQFVFQREPIFQVQENWDEKCFMCQAFAKDLEERMQLQKYLTETSIIPLVRTTCERLELPEPYNGHCLPLIRGKMLDDIAWLAKVWGESVAKRAKGEQRFGDKLCEEIDYCEKWMEPEKMAEKVAQQSMDMVFF